MSFENFYFKYFKLPFLSINKFLEIIEKSDTEKLNIVLTSNFDINQPFTYKTKKLCMNDCNALSFAIINKLSLDIIKLLVENGANISAHNDKCTTPLMFASLYYNDSHLIDYLVEKGAQVNEINSLKCCPLLISSCNPSLDIMKTLIRHGANLNERGQGGLTIIMLIVEMGHSIEHFKIMLESGADLTLKDNKDYTLLDYLQKEKNKKYLDIYNEFESKHKHAQTN